MTRDEYVEEFFNSYVECALWSSTDESTPDGGLPMDENYNADDIAQESLDEMSSECSAFVASEWNDLRDIDPGQAGHDFWLTRNGHGAGFWDRGLGAKGDRLSKACKRYGTSDLYVGDDGKVYVS